MLRTVLLLIGLGLAWPAMAAPRDLVVGVEDLEYYPLYAMRDGEYIGAARDILDVFAKDRGYRLVYRPLPIKRLYLELMSGGIDLKFPDNRLWANDSKKDHKVVYSKPVIAYIDGVLVRPGNHGRGPDALRTLGTVSGFTPFAWLDRVTSGRVALKENPRMELLLRQAVVGHVDGAYVSVAVANHVLSGSLNMPGALMFDSGLPHSREHYRLSSVTQPAMVAEFDAWLDANGALVKMIKDRYGAEKGIE
jgi:polar amino acid transport system substrate-binding protein